MKNNDLTPFEKQIIETINLFNDTRYKYFNLAEWSTDENRIKSNLQPGEIIYNVLQVFVAIKP